jgi:capsular exopolysaccharide synthesis family protein
MGRIDEALNRAARPKMQSHTAGVPREDVFQSPWRQAPEPQPPSRPLADRPSVLREPVQNLFRRFDDGWVNRLCIPSTSNRALVSQFSRLAGNLHNAQIASGMKVIMTTSAGPGEGKTLTALNLALVLSGSYGRRVLLIDADLRQPSIHSICGFDILPGLTEGLEESNHAKLPLVELSNTLSFLPAGRPNPDPMDRLTSERMRAILDEAVATFDWVILDAPPIGLVPDASLLAGMVDTALFVIRARHAEFAAVRNAVDAFGRDRIFGVVLNATDETQPLEYGGYYGAQVGARP